MTNGIISANVPSSYITEDDVKDIISANIPSSLTEDDVKNIISGEISGINIGMSIGTIFAYASSNPPAGALVLDGQTVLSSDYPDLYNWVKTNADNKTIRTITSAAYINEIEEYGFCGAFVINDSEKTVRLPDYRNSFLMGGDASNNSESVAPGLPQIPDHVHVHDDQYAWGNGGADGFGAGALTATSTKHNTKTTATNLDDIVNDIYGKSDTVQPPAIKTIWCIQAKKTNNYLGGTGCDCPDKNTIQSWIDDKIKNINTGTGLSIGTIFSHVSKNPPARCILT